MYRQLNFLLLFQVFVVLIGIKSLSMIDATSLNSDFSCDCDHCDGPKVKTIEENDPENDDTTIEKNMDTEDFDGDGDLTICARDRDFEDRTFSSICHMLCHNKCTRYRVWIYKVKKEKKYIASAFRTDYYKLHDGPC